MTWNPVWPDGTKSVKANQPTGQQNTTYMETNLNIDHFWNIGSDEDGHHKQAQMPKTETGGNPDDITLDVGMDGGMYLKENTDGVSTGFYRNSVNIYQFIPAFLTGTKALVATPAVNVVAVPANTYGQIYMFKNDDTQTTAVGFFRAGPTTLHIISTINSVVTFSESVLNITARSAITGTYEYRVTYWDI